MAKIRSKTGSTWLHTKEMVDAMCDVLLESLAKGHQTYLPKIGTFKVYHKKERKGINPSTLTDMFIPSKMHVKMRLSFLLKSRMQTLTELNKLK
jgi:nucleoid DNA-binding protein